MQLPGWLTQGMQLATVLVAGAIAWATITDDVRALRRDVDAHSPRIAALEDARGRVTGLEERVNWAAGNAADAKKLAETLLNDRLEHECGSK